MPVEIVGTEHLKFDEALNGRGVNHLRVDLQHVTHFNLYGLVGIAVALKDAVAVGRAISCTPPESEVARAFISRLGFDKFVRDEIGVEFEMSPGSSRSSRDDVVVELHSFRSSAELIPLQDLLWSRLEGVASPHARNALSEALWELGANVTEHSGSEGVMAAIVQRPGRREAHIDFAIGDAGIGIRRSFLNRHSRYHPNSDHEAITLAIKYLVSSVRDDSGRGQGLTTTVEQAIGMDGRILIRTGNARRAITGERAAGDVYQVPRANSVPPLAGTLVAVSVPCR